MRWGSLLLVNVNAHVLDLSHLERKKKTRILGIIGYSILQDFEILLDYPAQQITLIRLDKNGFRLDSNAIQEAPYDSVNFSLHRHLLVLEGKVQGIKLKLVLDSGAELNVVDKRLKRKLQHNFKESERKRIIGVGQHTLEAIAGTLYGFQLGRQYEESMQSLLTSMAGLRSAFNLSIDGVLGYEFLATRRTLINYKRKKLFFFPVTKP